MVRKTMVYHKIERPERYFHLLVPPIMLVSFAYTLTGTVLTDLIVYRTCLVSLNINVTECDRLRNNDGSPEILELEAKVEPYATTIVMTKSLIEIILPAVLSLFLGPWSDRGGRKPLILAVFTAISMKFSILSLMSNWNISPWYLLIASIARSITGGSIILGIAAYCYISDTASEKNRIIQMTLLQAIKYGGRIMGAFTGSAIYKYCGYTSVFGVAAICAIMTLVYTYFFLPETVKTTPKESIYGIFKVSHLKDLGARSSVKGDGLQRCIIWLGISILVVVSMISTEDRTIEFLFTRARLGWDVQQYSHYDAADAVLRVTGLCAVSLSKHFSEISDTVLVGAGLVSSLADMVTKSLTWKSWHMYLSNFLGVLGEVLKPIMRSIISQFIPSQDYGKVFSLTTILEVLSSLIGVPVYTFIYSHYLPPIYPSPAYLYGSTVYLLLILCIGCLEVLIRKWRKSSSYAATPQEDF